MTRVFWLIAAFLLVVGLLSVLLILKPLYERTGFLKKLQDNAFEGVEAIDISENDVLRMLLERRIPERVIYFNLNEDPNGNASLTSFTTNVSISNKELNTLFAFKELEKVVVENQKITRYNLHQLTNIHSLKHFSAQNCQLEMALSDLSAIPSLESLDVSGSVFLDSSDSDKRSGFSSLRTLVASHSQFSGDDFENVLESAVSLEEVDVSYTATELRGLKAITRSMNLKSVNLAGTIIPKGDLVEFCKLRNLNELNLSDTSLNDDEIEQLTCSESLKSLELSGCKNISGECLDKLRAMPSIILVDLVGTNSPVQHWLAP